MRISLAGQDDVDVGAPIMQRAMVQLQDIAVKHIDLNNEAVY